MDAFEVLHKMHTEAKDSFQQIEQSAPDGRAGLWAKLRPTLQLHEQIEERFVYDPASKDGGSGDATLQAWHQQHEQMVQQAEQLMSQIGQLDPREGQWLAQVTQLRSALEQHIATEEGTAWPRIRQVWGEDKVQAAGAPVQAAAMAGAAGATMSGAAGTVADKLKHAA